MRGHERSESAWVRTLRSSLIAYEEEYFILDDGSTRRNAKLIATERRTRVAGRLGEIIVRIERAIPEEFVRVPVERVRA